MQTALSQKAFSSAAIRPAGQAPRSRASLVVRATAEESRRAVVGGLLASVAALGLSAGPAQAVNLQDDRNVRDKGFDLIYEARDLDLPQSVRDGLTQARTSLEDTKKRIAESETRIDSKLEPYIKKQYWTSAREELRLQIGTLRFDLNTLQSQLAKPDRKKAEALKKTFLQKADELDFAIRKKDESAATKALAITKSSLDAVLASVL